MATATPTIKGYGRYRPHMLAPDRATTAGSRCAYSVGPAIRVENRIGEPAANHYLYMASQIALSSSVSTVRSNALGGGGPSARCASSRALARCLGSHRRLILA